MSIYFEPEDFDIYQPDPHDVEVERELIREANEAAKAKGNRTAKSCEDMREEAHRKIVLAGLGAALEEVRAAYERAKKASGQ